MKIGDPVFYGGEMYYVEHERGPGVFSIGNEKAFVDMVTEALLEVKVRYVLGFAFTPDQRVVLIEKKRPDWQAGRINGVGGKINDDETDIEAMVREFREETGVKTAKDNWRHFANIHTPSRATSCFSARGITGAKTVTDEEVTIQLTGVLPMTVLPNLRWLIPMAWLGEGFATMRYE